MGSELQNPWTDSQKNWRGWLKDMKADPKIGIMWRDCSHCRSRTMSSFYEVHITSFLFIFRRNYASILYCFQDVMCDLLKDTISYHSTCILAPLLGITPLKFHHNLWNQKTRFRGIIMQQFSVTITLAVLIEHRLWQTDGQTDRQTDIPQP